jgi:hypothetical protein
MPRTYVRKRTVTYSDSDLKSAISEVEKGKTIYVTAKKYNIPRETLRRWVTGTPSRKGSGGQTVLSNEEEHCIVVALKFLAQCGFPQDRQDIISIAKEYVQDKKEKFNCCSLGIEWARNLEKRWARDLTKRKPELLTKARSNNLSQNVVDDFFKMYLDVLVKNDLLKSPDRIFNLDEVGLGTDSRASKVFVERWNRNAFLKSPDAGKGMYSVVFCISADGNYLPPFTVYKSAHIYDSWTKGGPPGAIYGCTESGWMQDSAFESWMSNFAKQVESLNKPVLLVFDGHGSHLTYKTVKTAIDNNIIIVCIPPNTSHALQPLDVGVFAPIKRAWRLILKNWYRETRLQKVTKATFPHLLNKLFQELKRENAVKGFEGAGLYPVNKIPVEKRILLTEKLKLHELLEPPIPTDIPEQSPPSPSLVSSPMKDLKIAILKTLTPTLSRETRDALNNNNKKRKRVQHSAGEILTEKEVVERLQKEEIQRSRKRKKGFQTQPPKKQKICRVTEVPDTENPHLENLNELSPGKWILVKYKGKKSISHYVGQIIFVDSDGYNVKFLTKSNFGNYYTFPEKEKVETVSKSLVLKVLNEPNFDNRGHDTFGF